MTPAEIYRVTADTMLEVLKKVKDEEQPGDLFGVVPLNGRTTVSAGESTLQVYCSQTNKVLIRLANGRRREIVNDQPPYNVYVEPIEAKVGNEWFVVRKTPNH